MSSRRCVVIGAGILGASVAARLASSGMRVTLLDRDQPGPGNSRATSRWSFAWLNSNDKAPRHYHDLNHAGIRAWADDTKLDALVEVPWGKVPGRFALAGYVQEVLAHGWDLAKATGQPTEADPELARWSLATAKRILPPDIRGAEGVPFGPVVELPPDATPYAQLAAWLGRQP